MSKYTRFLSQLKKEHQTIDPFALANKFNIEVRYVPFGKNPKGMYTKIRGYPIIFINESVQYLPERKFVMAHELYHYLAHEENAAYYIQNDKTRSRLETEANKFAIALLTSLYIEETQEFPETVNEVALKYGVSYKENVEKLF